MNFDFKKLNLKPVHSPPLIVCYGSPGIGKTAFAIGADATTDFKIGRESHLLVNIDYRGADRLTCNRATELLNRSIISSADIDIIFDNLKKQEHNIKWVAFDDLSTMEEIFVDEVCKENNVSALGIIDYGRGYELAKQKWHYFFKGISDLQKVKSIGVMLIGHTKVDQQKDPMTETFSRHDLQLDRRSKEIIKKNVDLIGYAHSKITTKEVKEKFGSKENVPIGYATRVINFSPDMNGFESKDRFNLPEELPLDWAIFEQELNISLTKYNKKKETK